LLRPKTFDLRFGQEAHEATIGYDRFIPPY
jgi:hypothetical protein